MPDHAAERAGRATMPWELSCVGSAQPDMDDAISGCRGGCGAARGRKGYEVSGVIAAAADEHVVVRHLLVPLSQRLLEAARMPPRFWEPQVQVCWCCQWARVSR